MTRIDLLDLTKEYTPDHPGVSGLTLSIDEGEMLALLGPSGAGKTTVLRMVAGLLQPTRGDVRMNGRSVLQVPPEKRGAVMVFQENTLFPFMSVGKNVAFGLELQGLEQDVIQRRVSEALETVQIAGFENRSPHQLSGGQRQRVALARALVIRPKVLLLDEPLSNLEPRLRGELRAMICALQKDLGITTVFVTHDQAEAVAVADRIALLLEGRIRQVGPPRNFFERPEDAQVARFFGGVNFVPGVKDGPLVHTPMGSLQVPSSQHPDGEVLLTIRPEAIDIGFNGHNNLLGRVRACSYRGSMVLCQADVNGVGLQVTAPPYRAFEEGDTIQIHLPQERICLLPKE